MTSYKPIAIAYAEDHLAVRKGIILLLEESRMIEVIIECSDGLELIEKTTSAEKLPDLFLVDLSMPYMNGIELIKEIRLRWPKIPCLILTAFYQEYLLIEAVKYGAKGYLLKSVDPLQIVEAIERIHKQGFYYNEIYTGKSSIRFAAQKFITPSFNDREVELLKYVCTDLSYADIAALMNTTFKTVDGIRMRLYLKLNINTRVGLALVAIRYGYYIVDGDILVAHSTSNK